jgi:hypothetical protein
MGLEQDQIWHEADHQYLDKLYLPISLPPITASPAAGSAALQTLSGPLGAPTAFRIRDWHINFAQAAAFNATDNWTVRLFTYDTSGTPTQRGSFTTFLTAVRTVAGTEYRVSTSIDVTVSGTDGYRFYVDAIRNAAGGALTWYPSTVWIRPL